jgi:hypothetical protein
MFWESAFGPFGLGDPGRKGILQDPCRLFVFTHDDAPGDIWISRYLKSVAADVPSAMLVLSSSRRRGGPESRRG